MASMVFHKKNRMDEKQLARIARLLDREVMETATALSGGAALDGPAKTGGALLEELQEATNLRALWKQIEADAAEPEEPSPAEMPIRRRIAKPPQIQE